VREAERGDGERSQGADTRSRAGGQQQQQDAPLARRQPTLTPPRPRASAAAAALMRCAARPARSSAGASSALLALTDLSSSATPMCSYSLAQTGATASQRQQPQGPRPSPSAAGGSAERRRRAAAAQKDAQNALGARAAAGTGAVCVRACLRGRDINTPRRRQMHSGAAQRDASGEARASTVRHLITLNEPLALGRRCTASDCTHGQRRQCISSAEGNAAHTPGGPAHGREGTPRRAQRGKLESAGADGLNESRE
jgi:hypothetical protein